MQNLYAVIEHYDFLDYPRTSIKFFNSKEEALKCERKWMIDILNGFDIKPDDKQSNEEIYEYFETLRDDDKISLYELETININKNINKMISY